MEKLYSDIVVIGGGPGGAICSVTAKITYPDKEVMNIREFEHQMVPCAIPYIFSDILGSVENNLISCGMADKIGMKSLVGRVERVDLEEKSIYLSDRVVSFDKLVFATGSKTFVHPTLEPSLEFDGVFTVPKNVEYIRGMSEYIKDKKKVVVVGTGFIGIEMAMELNSTNRDVTVVGSKEYILSNSFDEEIAQDAHREMLNSGVKYISNDRVVWIEGRDGVVDSVKLKSGKTLEADVVILATGYKANTELAQGLGLEFGHYGGIVVDEYMRTTNPDVLAVGDCAMKRGFVLKSETKTMLASTASSEGRIAGMNIYGIQNLRNFSGTIAIFSTMVGEVAFSSAGVTEAMAKSVNGAVVSAIFEGSNRHPSSMPDAQRQVVKLIATQNTGQIIGGQIIGGKETGEMINMVGMIIENGMSIYDAMTMQVSTQPHLTSAPPAYPVVMCASMIASKLKR